MVLSVGVDVVLSVGVDVFLSFLCNVGRRGDYIYHFCPPFCRLLCGGKRNQQISDITMFLPHSSGCTSDYVTKS